jgi:hypothetical protein
MLKSSAADLLSKISEGGSHPRISVGLADGNRVSLANWHLAGDCLIENWPNGKLRYIVPLARIVIIEVADGD